MATSRTIALLGLLGVVGCNSSGTSRTINGQVVTGAYTLQNAAVFARATDGKVYGTHLRPDGSFSLYITSGRTYRLYIANTSPTGVYQAVTRVTWPSQSGRTHWAHIGAGGVIQLGSIRPLGSTVASGGLSTASVGGDNSNDNSGDNNNVDDGDQNDADDDQVCDAQNGDGSDATTDSQSDLQEGDNVNGDDGASGEVEADTQNDNQCGGGSSGGGASTANML